MDKPWKVITAFIGVFVAGAIFGGFFALGIGWQVIGRQAQPATPPAAVATVAPTQPPPKKDQSPPAPLPIPQALQTTMLKRKLLDRLDLTPAQRERIMPFIQRATEDFRRQQANYFREDLFILQRLQQDIARELTPDQRAKLVELEEKQAEIVRHRREAEMQAMKKAANGSPSPAPSGATGSTTETTSSAPTAAPSGTPPAASGSQTSGSTSTSAPSAEKKE